MYAEFWWGELILCGRARLKCVNIIKIYVKKTGWII